MALRNRLRTLYTLLLPRKTRKELERLVLGPCPRTFIRHRYIFIHIPKTGGKSVLHLLGIRRARHLTYADYERIIGPAIRDYVVFTVVRDPLQRLLSAYNYLARGGNGSAEDLRFKKNWIDTYPDIDTFIQKSLGHIPPEHWGKFTPQTDFLVDSAGEPVSSILIFHLETLQEDLARLPPGILTRSGLPHFNQSRIRADSTRISEQSLRTVADFYQRDYQLLGYTAPV